MSKLRVLIIEAGGEQAVRELLSILPLQFSANGAEVPVAAPPVQETHRAVAPPLSKQIPTAKPENSTATPARKRGPTPNYSMYPMRTATTRHPSCALCPRAIEIGEQYNDGGAPSYRVHIACAEKTEAQAA